MTIVKKNEEKPVFGVIVGNRDVFPDHLAKEGRLEIISVLKELGYECIVLNEDDTKFGVVETYSEAKKCTELFKTNRERISGIIVILPNFCDEKAVVNTLKLSELNVPIAQSYLIKL